MSTNPRISGMTEKFDKLSYSVAIAAGWPLIGLSLFISLDVLLRKLFNFSLQGSDEIGGYVMAVVCAFGFSFALAKRAHIRLSILLPRLPKALQTIINVLAYLALTAYAYLMLWQMAWMLIGSFRLKAVAPTPLMTPLVIPQSVCVAGLTWFSLHLTSYLMQIFRLIMRGQIDEFNKTFGLEAIEKEAAKEVEEAKKDLAVSPDHGGDG